MKIARWKYKRSESGFTKWHADKGNYTVCGKTIPYGAERDEQIYKRDIIGFPETICQACFL
jgi:hypothetical protein